MEKGREKKSALNATPEGFYLTVKRPEPLRSLLVLLADLERISEVVSEDRSSDLGLGAQSGAAVVGRGAKPVSSRQKAIQSLPPVPIMKRKLTRHLRGEIRLLEAKAKRLARRTSKGSAFLLNQLYARIRKIQALVVDLTHAVVELVERLYIRLFIDHQQLV